MTVTVAGVSRTVRPSRLALVATAPLLSGVVVAVLAGWPGGAVGAGWAAGAAVGAGAGAPRRVVRLRGVVTTWTGGSGVVCATCSPPRDAAGGAVCAAPGLGAAGAISERITNARRRARGKRADARRPKLMR